MTAIKRIPELPNEPTISRYARHVSTDGGNVWFVDRVTGQEVLTYNALDTSPGKVNEADLFEDMGLNIGERVLISRCLLKPKGRELLDYNLREAVRAERDEEIANGKELLVELDLWSFLGLDAGQFDSEKLEHFESHSLLPALEAKGFTNSVCFTDTNGQRGVRTTRNGTNFIFFYA